MKASVVASTFIGFLALLCLNNIIAGEAPIIESSIDCNKCWKIWEKNIKRSIYFSSLASESENKTAGGETSAWWNEQSQKYFDKIRECCLSEQMNHNCRKLDSARARKMCINESPIPKNPEKNENSTKPTCDQRQPNWVRGLLDAFGFCHSSPTTNSSESSHWVDCKRIKQHCIHYCADWFLPGDASGYQRCLWECQVEAGCL